MADRVKLWWDPKRPNELVLWSRNIRLGDYFFYEIIQHPAPLDMNILKAIKRCYRNDWIALGNVLRSP